MKPLSRAGTQGQRNESLRPARWLPVCAGSPRVVRAAYEETHTAIPYQVRSWLYAAEAEMAAARGRNRPAGTPSIAPLARSARARPAPSYPISR